MNKRVILPALLLPAIVGSGIVTAPTAHAAAQCTLTAPKEVHVWHQYTKVNLRASGACSYGEGLASWDAYHPTQGIEGMAFFDGSSTDIYDFYDWDDFGTYTWRPAGAWSDWDDSAFGGLGGYHELTQNTPRTTFRLGSKVTMSTSRSRSRVTLRVSATRWSPTASRIVKYSGINGSIQYRTSNKAAWKTLKSFRTSKSGGYSLTYTSSKSRHYRTVLRGTGTVWAATSGTSTR